MANDKSAEHQQGQHYSALEVKSSPRYFQMLILHFTPDTQYSFLIFIHLSASSVARRLWSLQLCITESVLRSHRSQQVAAMLREFVHSHEKQITSYAHDMTTTSDLLRQMMEEMLPDDQCGNLIPALQRNLQVFFRQVRWSQRFRVD